MSAIPPNAKEKTGKRKGALRGGEKKRREANGKKEIESSGLISPQKRTGPG